MTTKQLTAFLLAVLLIITATGSARPYVGQNAGLAWNWGGIELIGTPGLFLCPAPYNQFPYYVDSPFSFLRPYWLQIFPVSDC